MAGCDARSSVAGSGWAAYKRGNNKGKKVRTVPIKSWIYLVYHLFSLTFTLILLQERPAQCKGTGASQDYMGVSFQVFNSVSHSYISFSCHKLTRHFAEGSKGHVV